MNTIDTDTKVVTACIAMKILGRKDTYRVSRIDQFGEVELVTDMMTRHGICAFSHSNTTVRDITELTRAEVLAYHDNHSTDLLYILLPLGRCGEVFDADGVKTQDLTY